MDKTRTLRWHYPVVARLKGLLEKTATARMCPADTWPHGFLPTLP